MGLTSWPVPLKLFPDVRSPPAPFSPPPPNNLHDQSIHTRGRLSPPLLPHPQVIYCSRAPTQPLVELSTLTPLPHHITPTNKSHTKLSLHTADTPLTFNYPQSLLNSHFPLTFKTLKSFSDLHTLTKNFSIPQCHPSTAAHNGFSPSPTPNLWNFSRHNVQHPFALPTHSKVHKDNTARSFTDAPVLNKYLSPKHRYL